MRDGSRTASEVNLLAVFQLIKGSDHFDADALQLF
jgi:hypothetical protein